MFTAVLLSTNTFLENDLHSLALESRSLRLVRAAAEYPVNAYELARFLSRHAPEVVLIDATDPERALAVARAIRDHSAGIALVAFAALIDARAEAAFAPAGVEFLRSPFSAQELNAAVRTAIYAARPGPLDNLYVFLPAKAGSGASTVILNLAAALAAGASRRVLLLEADLHSGVLSVALNVSPKAALIDVLESADSLDYSGWERYIVKAHSIDLLPTDRSKKTPLPTWVNYHHLLRFAAPRYDFALADLPEVVNDATANLVHYARSVFVVCTPELTSLQLAGQRLQELDARRLPRDRVGIILNRWHRGDVPRQEVEEILGARVFAVIRNDYRSVHAATMSGRPVRPDTELGRSFAELARQFAAGGQPAAAPAHNRMDLFKALRPAQRA